MTFSKTQNSQLSSIDLETLLRVIELLDRYMFILQDDTAKEAENHKKYIGITLYKLRDLLKIKC